MQEELEQTGKCVLWKSGDGEGQDHSGDND
jgi:hypothetical protein